MASADPAAFANVRAGRPTPGSGVLSGWIGRTRNPIPLPTGPDVMMEEVGHSGVVPQGMVRCACPLDPGSEWVVVPVLSAGRGD